MKAEEASQITAGRYVEAAEVSDAATATRYCPHPAMPAPALQCNTASQRRHVWHQRRKSLFQQPSPAAIQWLGTAVASIKLVHLNHG